MKMTSAQAAKELRKLNEEHAALMDRENKSREFVAAIQEDVESVRPAYDYALVQQQLEELEKQIRHLKHAINAFNLTQEVPGFDMTIDQMLVYLPQLMVRKMKLDVMRKKLLRERTPNYGRNNNIVEYTYANYDIEQVQEDYLKAADMLARAQNALDAVNNSVTFEV
ncbi:MAG: hypothetical protein IJ708_15925 [Clostridia bacterium]|nr:hypothetical protein [Clostridia bacterium]